MYNPISSSMIYTPHFAVGLQFDLTAFEELVTFSVKSVRYDLDSYKEAGKGKREKYEFVHAIGIGMEIIQSAIHLHIMTKHDVSLKEETKSTIKALILELNTLIHELGEDDSDFCTDYATQRVTTQKEMLQYMEKNNW